MMKKRPDPVFWKRFHIKTPIKYLLDVEIKRGSKERFLRSWKRFWKGYNDNENGRERRFRAFLNRLQKEKDDASYCKRVAIRFISPKVGYGVFAKENIPPYALLGNYAGVLSLDKKISKNNDSTFTFNDYKTYSIDALKAGNWTRFMNHAAEKSPHANVIAWEYFYEKGPRIIFTATSKGIKKGEQLLYFYGTEYWDEEPLDL